MLSVKLVEWVAWNLMLAAIPVLIAYPLAALIEKLTLKKHKIHPAVWIVPCLVWLAFLPNTCYLLSEWRHFLFDAHFTNIRDDAGDNPFVVLRVAKQGLFFIAYSAVGALFFTLAIRPMHRVLQKAKISTVLVAIPFFLMISMGVYLGLIVRLNSWDIIQRPGVVLKYVIHAASTPALVGAITGFAGLLWLLYIIVDMWVDGFKMRLTKAHS